MLHTLHFVRTRIYSSFKHLNWKLLIHQKHQIHSIIGNVEIFTLTHSVHEWSPDRVEQQISACLDSQTASITFHLSYLFKFSSWWCHMVQNHHPCHSWEGAAGPGVSVVGGGTNLGSWSTGCCCRSSRAVRVAHADPPSWSVFLLFSLRQSSETFLTFFLDQTIGYVATWSLMEVPAWMRS